jgi:hypothetical protein
MMGLGRHSEGAPQPVRNFAGQLLCLAIPLTLCCFIIVAAHAPHDHGGHGNPFDHCHQCFNIASSAISAVTVEPMTVAARPSHPVDSAAADPAVVKADSLEPIRGPPSG